MRLLWRKGKRFLILAIILMVGGIIGVALHYTLSPYVAIVALGILLLRTTFLLIEYKEDEIADYLSLRTKEEEESL